MRRYLSTFPVHVQDSMKIAIATLALMTLMTFKSPASANSTTASVQGSATTLGHIVGGSAKTIGASAGLAILSVSAVVGGAIVVLKDVSTGADVKQSPGSHFE